VAIAETFSHSCQMTELIITITPPSENTSQNKKRHCVICLDDTKLVKARNNSFHDCQCTENFFDDECWSKYEGDTCPLCRKLRIIIVRENNHPVQPHDGAYQREQDECRLSRLERVGLLTYFCYSSAIVVTLSIASYENEDKTVNMYWIGLFLTSIFLFDSVSSFADLRTRQFFHILRSIRHHKCLLLIYFLVVIGRFILIFSLVYLSFNRDPSITEEYKLGLGLIYGITFVQTTVIIFLAFCKLFIICCSF